MTLMEQTPLDSPSNIHDNLLPEMLREHDAVMLFIDSATGGYWMPITPPKGFMGIP